ncbi:MAG TPA: hypothetical protein DDX91_00035 [Ruminococcaceae bacterium]|nr:hypothetical protein [Oscillospiraceae bacterium]
MKFTWPVNSEEKNFCRHIDDLIFSSQKQFCVRFSGFLTEREQTLALAEAHSLGVECSFFGGYADASRKIFAAPKASDEEFPLSAITFLFRRQDNLTHRDFLGALMSLGINRNLIGDIKVGQGEAIIFVLSTVSALILDEVKKIGNVGVKATEGICTRLPKQEFDVLNLTVSSLRIDAVVSAVCGISREKSYSLIRSGSVIVSGIQVGSSSEIIDIDEVFSVKGYGKYFLSEIGSLTKKGKVHIKIKKYK